MAVSAFPELEPADEAFWAAVRALPRRQCEVVALHYLEDMSVADLAAPCAHGLLRQSMRAALW
jgi:DNA-directed RNA polymerase specialized sigma24 family protein